MPISEMDWINPRRSLGAKNCAAASRQGSSRSHCRSARPSFRCERSASSASPRNEWYGRSKRAESTTSASQMRRASVSSPVPNGGVDGHQRYVGTPLTSSGSTSAARCDPAAPWTCSVTSSHEAGVSRGPCMGWALTVESMRPARIWGWSLTTMARQGWCREMSVTVLIARFSSLASGTTVTSVITQFRGCGCSSSPASTCANWRRERFSAPRTSAMVTDSPCQSSSGSVVTLKAGATRGRPPRAAWRRRRAPTCPSRTSAAAGGRRATPPRSGR